MPKKSNTNHNREWTPADEKKLRKLARQKLPARLAAPHLGRSVGAVKFKAMVLGVRFRAINQPPGVQLARARRERRKAARR